MKQSDLIKATIALLVIIVFGYFYYQKTVQESVPGENKSRLANQFLEDGKQEEALKTFNEAIAINPDYAFAYMGKAIALMQLERYDDSKNAFNRAIELDKSLAPAYANRGILNDRTGRYKDAIADYRKALELNPELAKGPGWLWRFLRNVREKPPTIADRVDYLEEELKKPESERLLRVPQLDDQQRMYKK